jgi:predicted nucleotide-binding protein
MANNRPVIFVGSSKEGLSVAEALQINLDYVAEVVLWSQGVFGLSEGTLESLVEKLPSFDFAILVLTPDDVAITSGEVEQLPRDNVLFELGLFMGSLGRDRCFIVYDRSKQIKLPSDLAGVTPAKFQLHSSGNLVSSLGSASTQVKTVIEKLGQRPRELEQLKIAATTQFRVIADLLETTGYPVLHPNA